MTEEEPKRDYGLGEDGKGWVQTEMRELEEDSRKFVNLVAVGILGLLGIGAIVVVLVRLSGGFG